MGKCKLTRKQKIFVAEYGKDCNGAQAAIRTGYSPRTAKEQAARLLTDANVREAVEKQEAEHLKSAGVEGSRILIEFARVGLSDIRKLYNADGTMKLPHEWDDATAAAVTSVEVFEEFLGKGIDRVKIGETRKVRMAGKVEALTQLAKHLKLLGDDVLKIQLVQPEYSEEERKMLKELALARAKRELEVLQSPPALTDGKE